MPSRPRSVDRIDHLLLLLRKALKPYRSAYKSSPRPRTGDGQQPSIAQEALASELALVLELAILRSRRHREPANLPSEELNPRGTEPDLAIDLQAAMAREILKLHYPLPVESENPDLLWKVYRAALLQFVQTPPFQPSSFSKVTKDEEEAALRRLSGRFVRGWDTTSSRMSADAREGLRELQKNYDIDRSAVKRAALKVGLLRALDDWEEPRRIRIAQWWIYEETHIAEFELRGLNELGAVEHLALRVDDHLGGVEALLEPVDGFAVLVRHLRRQMFKEAEAWLADRSRGAWLTDAGLTDVPEDVKPNLRSLKSELVDADVLSQGAFDSSPVVSEDPAPAAQDPITDLLESADTGWSSHHREALESLTPDMESRILRLLELLSEDWGDVAMGDIKQQVAEEEDVTDNAIDKFYSRLREAATGSD